MLAQSTRSANSLLARVSYTTGHVVDWTQEQGYPKICLAVHNDGHYRLLRVVEKGTETLQGTLPQNKLSEFDRLLKNLDFDRSGGAIIRGGAESFVAEVVREEKVFRHIWINPDDERPFPRSARKLVQWLQTFKAEQASPLVHRDLDEPICPPLTEDSITPLGQLLKP